MTDIDVSVSGFDEANQQLKLLEKRIALDAQKAAFEKASPIVVEAAKNEVPEPGYKGDKQGKVPLQDTLTFKVEQYRNGTTVAIIGAGYPRGAHAHLVEDGHEIYAGKPATATGRKTTRDEFMKRAVDNTSSSVEQTIMNTVKSFAK